MSQTPVDLYLTHGVPATLQATVVGGVARWGTSYVLRGKIRTRPGNGSVLLDLGPYLTAAPSGADLAVTLHLTGAEIRTLKSGGVYDIFVSESTNSDEDNSLRVAYGDIYVEKVSTT